jgi:hypothetical protein
MSKRFEKEIEWITRAGLRAVCLIIDKSHRCGYVAVERGHRLYCVEYDELPSIEVHGGLTFSGITGVKPFENLSDKIYPIKTETPTWWFGFDCAHAYDGFMEDSVIHKLMPKNNNPVRSMEYVIHECERLAEQLL